MPDKVIRTMIVAALLTAWVVGLTGCQATPKQPVAQNPPREIVVDEGPELQ